MELLRHSGAALSALLAAPVAAVAFVLRPAWRVGGSERLGIHPGALAPGAQRPTWVHGASVGEITAALPLIDALAERGPVVASTTTLTGRALIRERRPAIPSGLAPLDHPWCVARALDRVRPARLVLIETELWPGWIAGCARREIPVLLASARISDRSLPRYRRFAWALRPSLERLRAVGARSDADAERFAELGVPAGRIRVTGDLKLDQPAEGAALAPALAACLDGAPLLVAGSTHPAEEVAVLDALALAETHGHALRLVVAPRRPERLDEVAAALDRSGRRWRRRTALGDDVRPLAPGEVLLLDSMGELSAVYARATVAFVGGTLAPVGGHNLLEPLHHGVPVLFGPHTEAVRQSAEWLVDSGAGRRVADAAGLGEAVLDWLAAPPRLGLEAGAAALAEHRGATDRMLAWIDASGEAS